MEAPLTDQEIIEQLIKAGWAPEEAAEELERMIDQEEVGSDGNKNPNQKS